MPSRILFPRTSTTVIVIPEPMLIFPLVFWTRQAWRSSSVKRAIQSGYARVSDCLSTFVPASHLWALCTCVHITAPLLAGQYILKEKCSEMPEISRDDYRAIFGQGKMRIPADLPQVAVWVGEVTTVTAPKDILSGLDDLAA